MRQIVTTSPRIARRTAPGRRRPATLVTGGFVAAAMAAATLLATPPSPALASPAAPAHAAGIVHLTSAALTAARTMSFTAHAATSGRISPLSNPLDITCTLTIGVPTPEGANLVDSHIVANAATSCRFDIDGSFAKVSVIDLTEQLLSDNTLVGNDHAVLTSDDLAYTLTSSWPCRHGNWTNSAQVVVTFPPGYVPHTVSGSSASQIFIGLGDCPGDKVPVPDVSGESVSRATADLQAAGLVAGAIGSTVSCDVPKNTIESTDPSAGTLVLLGSTVTMRKSVGLPATPCP